ncbi:post-transcriptional regulator [Sporosarcina jiandibaonis]|uniref:post-transcriptional regulator n=1 Tax=Sporosarcina jiandibaonis TaxID=2715535 RepID=UPI001552B1A2|nr:post-transcriptional regulator [Sporosarcina jiandibaonis]
MSTEHGPIYAKMLPALQSKMNEFHLYGYTTVTVEDIWIYCIRKIWRKKDVTQMGSHQIMNDILQILPAAFMTYTQIEAQRNSDWFSDLNSADLQILLNPKKDVENEQ